MIDTFATRLGGLRSEGGFMLLEVLVSAVLVALIAVGTYTGLASSGSASARERGSAQAVVIAQQDEERMRGLSVTELAQLGQTTYSVGEEGECVEEKSGGWYYYSGESQWKTGCAKEANSGQAYTHTVYTITSQAEYVSAATETLACESGEAKDYIRTISTVTWSSIGSHEPVKQTSIVDEPSTGMLMVKVKDRNNKPVSGATVEVFDPASSTKATASETTPSSGCMIIGGLEEGEVKLIASNAEWVTHNGKTSSEKLTSVKKGSLAETEFTLERSGTIAAEFTNTSGGSASSFTFVAYQPEIASSAPFFVGGAANSAASTATLNGLFPFAFPVNEPDKYTVYAGDCEANEPAQATKGSGSEEAAKTVQVEPYDVKTVNSAQIPLPKTELVVYEGTGSSSPGAKLSSVSAKIINSECKGKAAQNYASVPYEHEEKVTSGELAYPYLPYAKKLELCVVGKVGTKYYRHYFSFVNNKKTGVKESFYLQSSGYTEASSC